MSSRARTVTRTFISLSLAFGGSHLSNAHRGAPLPRHHPLRAPAVRGARAPGLSPAHAPLVSTVVTVLQADQSRDDSNLLPHHRHLGDDQAVVGAHFEVHPLARSVDHDLLEELERRLLVVDDLGGLGVELLALLLVERVARLLHQVVEALAGLAARPGLAG